ncbi:MAG: ferritin family protein [Halobacteria archaeon]|nr:ferritin family protein [Halobacteria archaeon]
MDAETLVEEVKEAKQTELERLGSSKSLMATTNGNLDSETVVESTAEVERAAVETFSGWADDEEDETARRLFERIAEQEQEHYDRISAEADGDGGSIHDYMRGLDDAPARIGAGLIGRSLVSDATLKQTVGFFVGQSDRKNADLFRDLREETRDMLADGEEALDEVCGDDENECWERAREAAEEVIQIAYDDYAETLEGMGVNPKPVC